MLAQKERQQRNVNNKMLARSERQQTHTHTHTHTQMKLPVRSEHRQIDRCFTHTRTLATSERASPNRCKKLQTIARLAQKERQQQIQMNQIKYTHTQIAKNDLQSVCVYLISFIWICCWRSSWASLFIDCNFLHRFADALSEPASLCVCVKNICRFACVRSEPAISFVCVCLLSLAPSQHLLFTPVC